MGKSLIALGAIAALATMVPGANAAEVEPVVKMLAIGTLTPGTEPQQAMAILPAEVKATVDLYLKGKIDQWYSLEGRRGVVFLLNTTDEADARAMLEDLPLGRAHLMRFELLPLTPLAPLRRLEGMGEAPR